MLVLSRKASERIQIGDSVVVTVVRIAGNVVRLGIEAPRETSIVRQELRLDDPDSGSQYADFSGQSVTTLDEVTRKI